MDSVLDCNLRAEAEKRGYIVIAPAAPEHQLFFEEGARVIPAFLKSILVDYISPVHANPPGAQARWEVEVAGPQGNGIR